MFIRVRVHAVERWRYWLLRSAFIDLNRLKRRKKNIFHLSQRLNKFWGLVVAAPKRVQNFWHFNELQLLVTEATYVIWAPLSKHVALQITIYAANPAALIDLSRRCQVIRNRDLHVLRATAFFCSFRTKWFNFDFRDQRIVDKFERFHRIPVLHWVFKQLFSGPLNTASLGCKMFAK